MRWGFTPTRSVHPSRSTAMAWLDQAQAYTERYGAKPIWITELGWSTYSGSGSGYIGVSEASQAAYLARAYLDAARRGVRGIFWYDLIEDGTSTTSLSQNYGLVQRDGRLKPAYTALAHVAAALDQSVSVGSASPSTAGQATTVSDMASPSGWSAVNLGGGWSQLTATTARHSGAGALKLDYSFGSSGTGVEAAHQPHSQRVSERALGVGLRGSVRQPDLPEVPGIGPVSTSRAPSAPARPGHGSA